MSRLPDIVPGPLMLKKGLAASARFSSDEEDEEDEGGDDGRGMHGADFASASRGVAAGRGAYADAGEGEDGEADDPPPQIVADRSALAMQGEDEDDGLTAAQRDQERKRRGKRGHGDDEVSHKQRIEAFNAKLAKLTDINEMPRISGM